MWMVPQRIEEQDVEVLQLSQRLFRHAAEIGEIRGRTEAIAFDGNVAMMHRQRSERGAEQIPAGHSQAVSRLARVRRICNPRRRCSGKRCASTRAVVSLANSGILSAAGNTRKAERPDIVEPENVVSVAVSVEHGVDLPDALADGLLAEIRRGVDEYGVSVPLHHDRRSRAAVVRVGDVHTRQSQPIVGTPIEVPLPSTVSVAFIRP